VGGYTKDGRGRTNGQCKKSDTEQPQDWKWGKTVSIEIWYGQSCQGEKHKAVKYVRILKNGRGHKTTVEKKERENS